MSVPGSGLVGELAPDFTLQGTLAKPVTLSGLTGSHRALLIFYPKNKTSG